MARPLPLVAIVGRPNVGKSTLFNRLIGERLAIVEDMPGTTRDRLYAPAEWNGKAFNLVDTGGLELGEQAELSTRIRNQVELAMDEAQVIVFVVDGAVGPTADDEAVAGLLRRVARPVVLAVNKTERPSARLDAAEFWALGLGEPCPISARHGTGSGDLLDRIAEALPERPPDDEVDERLRVAIVGRPNVGKSSLLNKLLGEERMVVSPVAGTTRDAVDTVLRYHGEEIVLVDTAGIRRRGKVEPGIEKYAVLRADRAVDRSDVAVLLLDAQDRVTAQDAHIAGFIEDSGKGVVVAVNKWDLIERDTYTADEFRASIREDLKFMPYAPILFISALTGQRVSRVLDAARQIDAARKFRIPTGELNRLIEDLQIRHTLSRKGRQLKLRYATQVGVAPPTFLIFVNDLDLVHFGYERYVENQIRQHYPYEGTPIRLIFRAQRRGA